MIITILIFTILSFMMLMGIYGALSDIRAILKSKEFTVYNIADDQKDNRGQ